MTPLETSGVALDTEKLLWLRHLARVRAERPSALTALPGGFIVKRRGRGLELDDIRIFVEGDDMRHLDRNTTARTGVPHVRTFRDERERTLILAADFRPSMLWGTRRAFRSVAAAEAAVLAGWRAIDRGERVGLLAFGAGEPIVMPARGRERGMLAVVGGLGTAHAAALADPGAPEPPLTQAADLLVRVAPRGSSVVFLSGFDEPGTDFGAAVGPLLRRVQVSAFVIADAFELRAPAGKYPYLDAASGAARVGHIQPRYSPLSQDARLEWLAQLGFDAALVDAEGGPSAFIDILEELDARFR